MSHEITLEQAADSAWQVEIIARLMESYPHKMLDCEVAAMASLIAKLSDQAVMWMGEEMAQRGKGQ